MSIDYQTTRRSIELSHGTLNYHEAGSGPSLLMIHGSGPGVSGWANFSGNLAWFSRRFRCLVVDLPGYGGSQPLAGDPIAGAVKACLEFLDAVDAPSAHVLGNSLGGMVGSHIAAAHPERVRSLTCIGGIGLNLFAPFPAEGVNLLTAFAEAPSRERLEAWLRSMVYDQTLITPELIDTRWEQAIEPNTLAATRQIYSRESIGQIAAMREQHPTRAIEHLATIQVPTLLTWGRDDRVTPLDAALLPMRLIPLCELHTFPHCGHWAMIECKQAFETLVMSFLCRDEPGGPDVTFPERR